MAQITIQTSSEKQVIDITGSIMKVLAKQHIASGTCTVFVLHTTAAITTADLDPGTDLDMLDAFAAIMPKLPFRHPHDPSHVPDHIWSSIIGPSVTIPVEDGELMLGTWQRVVLIELDGPRKRNIVVRVTEAKI